MKKRFGTLIPLLLVVLGSLCMFVLSEEIVRDYDRSFDFSQLKTYRWMELKHRLLLRANPQATSQVSDEQIDQIIRSAVDEQLKKRGFVLTAETKADFLVSYFAVGELEIGGTFYDSAPTGNLPYNHWRPFYQPGTDTRMNSKGTLTIDIVNPENNQLLWRGQATDTIKRTKDLEKVTKKAAKKILSKFPPKR